MSSFERPDVLHALTTMVGKSVSVLVEGTTSRASYLAAFHGKLLGPEDGEADGRWMIDDGQQPQRFDGTWFMVPHDVTGRLSDGTVVMTHRDGQITVTADVPMGEKIEPWKRGE